MTPMKIIISHQEFIFTEEEFSRHWGSGMGRADSIDGTVRLRSGLPPGTREATILHEILHLIADMNDLKIKDDDTVISVLATQLLDFLRGNPELVAQICGRESLMGSDCKPERKNPIAV